MDRRAARRKVGEGNLRFLVSVLKYLVNPLWCLWLTWRGAAPITRPTKQRGSVVADQRDSDADRDRDAERLKLLEQRLAERRTDTAPTPGADKFHQANQAWRMVVELVAGLAIGFGIGFGLDTLFGTAPFMLIVFVLLGFAAGIKTMLRTAAEMGKTPDAPARDDPAERPETKGTKRGD